MKIQYLGTAAAEGVPSIFCRCPKCEMARKQGGKNIRARTHAIIDDDLLVDFPPDAYLTSIRFNVDLSNVKHLLITHTHLDHFAPCDLKLRKVGFADNMSAPILTVYGTKTVGEKLKERGVNTVEFVELKLLEPTAIGEYIVTALPAIHMLGSGEQPVTYLIEKNGKTLFYCLDTGLDQTINQLPASIIEYFRARNIKIDFIGLDCTYGVNDYGWGQHLSLAENEIIIKHFKQEGFITDKTILYATHFSHWNVLEQEEFEKEGAKYGVKIAYDGLKVEF